MHFFWNFKGSYIANIDELNKKFIKRNNNDGAKNKLDFKNTLYAPTQILKKTSIDNGVADLEHDNIVSVSKNSLVKKRNNDTAGAFIKELNNIILKMIYNPKNKFLKPYNFKPGPDKKSYMGSGINYNKNDKKLYINRTTTRFIASDGSQLNVSKKLIYNNIVKASKSKNYGLLLYYGYMMLSMKSQLHIIQLNQQHQILRKKK